MAGQSRPKPDHQSFKYMCGFLPWPFSTSLISPSCRRLPRGLLSSRLGNGERTGLVDEVGRACRCEEAPVVLQDVPNEFHYAILPVPFHCCLRGHLQTPRLGEAWPGLVWDVRSQSAVAAVLSKRLTALISFATWLGTLSAPRHVVAEAVSCALIAPSYP